MEDSRQNKNNRTSRFVVTLSAKLLPTIPQRLIDVPADHLADFRRQKQHVNGFAPLS